MPFQHRFLSVLAPFWKPRWLPNRSKIHQNWVFKPFCFRIVFYIDFSLIFSPNFDPLDLQKVCFSFRKIKFFSKKRLSKITSISASILVPTCLHVGLQNRRCFEILAFQEAFKFSSFFASIFYWFWLRLGLQLGANLGAKTAQNSKKWRQNIGTHPPKSGCEYKPAFEDRSRAYLPRFFGGPGLDFLRFLDMFLSFLAY